MLERCATRRCPGGNDYELYEVDDEFVLTARCRGSTPRRTVYWESGVLNVAAEHKDEQRSRRRSYVDDDE